MFNASARRLNHGHVIALRQVVTDFSFALITAVVAAFSGRMQLHMYLRHACRCLRGDCTSVQLKSTTFLSLCSAHMLKAVSRRLCKAERRMHVRKLMVTYFAALQNCSDVSLYPRDGSVPCTTTCASCSAVIATTMPSLTLVRIWLQLNAVYQVTWTWNMTKRTTTLQSSDTSANLSSAKTLWD